MQTWKAGDVEKVEQGNQSRCSLDHIILLTVCMDKSACYRTEASQEYGDGVEAVIKHYLLSVAG